MDFKGSDNRLGMVESKTELVQSRGLRELIGSESDTLPELFAGLVHEVKNPLAAIHLHLQLLESNIDQVEDERLKTKMNQRVDVIKKEIISLSDSLQGFIRAIRSEVREDRNEELNDLIAGVISLLEPQAEKEGVDLIFEPGKLPSLPNIDRTFVRQTVINLILNAIQAFSQSRRKPGEREITIETGQENQSSFIRISDNGPGISLEDQERIFEPFYTTKQSGSGLGLALVRRMINEMGGRVDVSSTPERGTTFTIYFGGPRLLTD